MSCCITRTVSVSSDPFVPRRSEATEPRSGRKRPRNQTRIKTSTGIWFVTYNGENRPVLWENVSTNSPPPNSSTPNSSTPPLISMSFDRMGRRVTKNDRRFVYDGYLQIAKFEHQTSNIKLQTFIWDPTEPIATRPLVWKHDGETLFYVHDGNKNVSEVVASDGTLAVHYEYEPFGAVTSQMGALASVNPFRFSCEYAEEDTAMVYYNYRHYEPVVGRWLGWDSVDEYGMLLITDAMQLYEGTAIVEGQSYLMVGNGTIDRYDEKGLLGHVAGGLLVGCAAGATYSLISSLMGGESTCQCSCKAFGSCAVGAVFGALGAANPVWAGCLAGASSNIINYGVSSACDDACGKPQKQKTYV